MNPLLLYRVISYGHKISGFRLFVYVLLGYAVARVSSPKFIIINLLGISGAFAAGDLLNDYYDWKLLGENNYVSGRINNHTKLFFYVLLPSIFSALSVFFLGRDGIIMVLIYIIPIIYSVPPIRLKKRPFFSIITPPLGVALLFLQSTKGRFLENKEILLLSILIFFYHIYIECIHIYEDLTHPEEEKIMDERGIKRLMVYVCICEFVLSSIFSIKNPVFLAGTLSSGIRLTTIKKLSLENIRKVRRNPFGMSWGVFELGVYGLAGILGVFTGGV